MVGFEVSKKYLIAKYENNLISKRELNNLIFKLQSNFKNGTARRELEKSGIKNYMDY